jgi:uncharacterized protein YbaR (Trm112 family)
MKERLLNYLSCSSCGAAIALASAGRREAEEIIEGQLSCRSCARTWPITSGVPRFASLDEVEAEKAATAAGFGWQWQHFTQADDKYEQQFLGWIAPVTPEFFQDKVVLETVESYRTAMGGSTGMNKQDVSYSHKKIEDKRRKWG